MKSSNYVISKHQLDTEEEMTIKREFICCQVFGVVVFCVGFVGGIVVGIYFYHGGPASEVTCKNIPQWLKDGEKNTKTIPTKSTTTLPTTETEDDECTVRTFTYTINNQIKEPYFNSSVTMEIEKNRPLIYYMERAVDDDPSVFTRFKATYYSKIGYFIDSINNVTDDKTYWQIVNASGSHLGGASSYIPMDGDTVLLNLTAFSRATD